MNRIAYLIQVANTEVSKALAEGKITAEKVESDRKVLDMEIDMFVDFQNRKIQAMMDGVLSTEEAQTVYDYLGATPEHFNGQSFAVKYVLMETYRALLERAIVLKDKEAGKAAVFEINEAFGH